MADVASSVPATCGESAGRGVSGAGLPLRRIATPAVASRRRERQVRDQRARPVAAASRRGVARACATVATRRRGRRSSRSRPRRRAVGRAVTPLGADGRPAGAVGRSRRSRRARAMRARRGARGEHRRGAARARRAPTAAPTVSTPRRPRAIWIPRSCPLSAFRCRDGSDGMLNGRTRASRVGIRSPVDALPGRSLQRRELVRRAPRSRRARGSSRRAGSA